MHGSADEEQVGSNLKREAVECTQLDGESPCHREVALQHAALTEGKPVARAVPLSGIPGPRRVEVLQ